ncbi:MAG TPA: cytochrome c3 family protein, partial [Desulfobacterales bacterium]|nr:cytochrome c3 family protein [Desulfobacterales bacterium]
MCHRAHSAPGVVARTQLGSWEMTGSALVLARPSDTGDAALCLTCHGIDALGSATEVQSGFLGDSAHSMMPGDSRYDGVPRKQCSSCHDAHGSERRADGTPYQALLRSIGRDGQTFYSREEYCGACHFETRDAQENRFDGLGVYRQTAHAAMALPASGTGITCSNCHAPHGSEIAPLIRSEITTPAAAGTTLVGANDRRLCYACHATARATWLGADVYDDETTRTVHGSSEVTLPVTAEYASEETTRRAGECQSCHNPMGADDGAGTPVARMTELEGRELCYSCHNAERAPAIQDMASWAVRAERMGDQAELVVAWDPESIPASYGALHVYTRAFADDAAPYGLEGPRPYRVAGAGARTGAIAAGDIDGLADTELAVGDPASPVLRVFRADPLAGLAYVTYGIAAPAAAVEIGDFLLEGTGRPEIAVLSVAADGASNLELYRWQAGGEYGTLSSAAGPYPVGYDATGLASGHLGLGSSAAEGLVVTARSAAATGSADAIFVAYQAVAGDAGAQVDSWPAQFDGVRGPSVGPVRDGAPAIVTANSGAAAPSISVYSPDGTSHTQYPVYSAIGAVAWDTVAGAFAADGGTAIAVAVRNETGAGGVSIFPVTGAGLGTRHDVPTGEGSASATLGAGRLTRDLAQQIVVANAGVLSWADGRSVSPSVQVIEWTGETFEVVGTHWGGGAESAGGSPAVAVVDLGPVGRSRHPASAVAGAHVSTETADFPRHVECVDCHNVHAATGDRVDDPPHVYGALRGTRGLDPFGEAYAPVDQVAYEYELCLKCHAGPAWGGSRRNIAAELDPSNEGFHPVVAVSGVAQNNPDSFVSGWG